MNREENMEFENFENNLLEDSNLEQDRDSDILMPNNIVDDFEGKKFHVEADMEGNGEVENYQIFLHAGHLPENEGKTLEFVTEFNRYLMDMGYTPLNEKVVHIIPATETVTQNLVPDQSLVPEVAAYVELNPTGEENKKILQPVFPNYPQPKDICIWGKTDRQFKENFLKSLRRLYDYYEEVRKFKKWEGSSGIYDHPKIKALFVGNRDDDKKFEAWDSTLVDIMQIPLAMLESHDLKELRIEKEVLHTRVVAHDILEANRSMFQQIYSRSSKEVKFLIEKTFYRYWDIIRFFSEYKA